jgi:hypothetical protein
LKEKIPRVLREPPIDGLRVVRELEPQDPKGNRGAKASFDTLRMVSPALREPQGREPVESVEPQREPSSEEIY